MENIDLIRYYGAGILSLEEVRELICYFSHPSEELRFKFKPKPETEAKEV
jgi:hypothetical protein